MWLITYKDGHVSSEYYYIRIKKIRIIIKYKFNTSLSSLTFTKLYTHKLCIGSIIKGTAITSATYKENIRFPRFIIITCYEI